MPPAPPPRPGLIAASLDAPGVLAWREGLRGARRRLVMTNGCFDLLHVGHLRYLAEARALGDALLVALNGDASVAQLKGAGRPLLPWAERAELLAGLRVVDAVLGFEEATAVSLVRALQPEVYVKGGDYGPGRWPPEADAARALGLEVRFLGLTAGRSTSDIVARIRAGVGA